MSDIPVVRFQPESDDELSYVLNAVQGAIERHPMAVQAAFAALSREGRRFAGTDEGAEWMSRLQGSELMSRLRVIWDSLSVTAFTEETSEALPSFFLDGIVRASSEPGLETKLSRVFERRT
jgi:hypothetical protein